ncbi:MAG TPA: carboxylesterase family protein, partial [Draconibacterium sp.]|nr:carboxylesterase family protein [Draconibacterium sp.]
MKILKNIGLIVCTLTLLASCNNQTPVFNTIKADSTTAIVPTTNGKVAGYIDRSIYTFKGIPYARAERFMPPEEPESWTGVRSSRSYGPVCLMPQSWNPNNDANEFAMQHDYGIMDENCQNLNIWTQNINNNEKKPVMVWLHGGGYSSGSSHELPTYDGLNLSKTRNVVVVSINHRLNILGYLDLSGVNEKYKYSANVGMLDQVAALKWVQNNIQNFGGDPDNITIFGQSGGGGKVCTLMQMPAAKGLFHKAISQSNGSMAFNDTTVTRLIGLAILEELGLNEEQVDSLQKIPYEVLYNAGTAAKNKILR